MKDDPRKILLLNRVSIMNDKPNLPSADFSTHIHMSWPGFYDAVSHLSKENALILMFSTSVAYDNSGVLMNVGQSGVLNNPINFQGGSDDAPHSIH
ncbi:hypothetical protein LCGC14_1585760 [marine sediment metagenome]|uniref:Uncharacterized protein n=1 Tax=marine sediment metagenome TaxID=412755 RepID=A0A0F9KW43_9ZZZZ